MKPLHQTPEIKNNHQQPVALPKNKINSPATAELFILLAQASNSAIFSTEAWAPAFYS